MTVAQLELHAAPRRPVMRYHGGKFRIASWVVSHLPAHRVYVEPFAGAASVLLRKPRSHGEVINDLDEEIVHVFRVLRDPAASAELRRLLDLTPYSRAELKGSYEVTPDPIERARRTIVRSFMGFSSASVTKEHRTGFRASSNRSNKVPSADWASYPQHLEHFVERLRGVTIEQQDASEAIRRHDTPETLFYVDPPYPFSTRTESARWGDCYRHEMTDGDHARLSELLHSVKGMVVLSGYNCALYERLYGSWEVVTKRAFASSNKSSVARVECLWLSPSASAALAKEAAS